MFMLTHLRLLAVIFLLAAATLACPSQAAPPPDNTSKDAINPASAIYASMDQVDDVGLVIVWNGDGARTVASCEWRGGQHGTASVKLDEKCLTKGVNYVIF